MAEGFDLNLLPLYRIDEREPETLPGLLAVVPPRRAARGRERDRLIAHLTLSGTETFTTAEALQLTGVLAEAFYAAAGSVTGALRAAADSLNRTLLERNLRSSGSGQYTVGALTLATLRGNQMVLLLSGPVHVFVLGAGPARHIHDPQLSGRGLGLGQTLTSFFSRIELAAGDRLLLCEHLPPPWEALLLAERGPSALDATRRRLFAAWNGDVNAVLLQLLKGTGRLTVMRPGRESSAPRRASALVAPRTAVAPVESGPTQPPSPAPARAVSAPVSGEAPTSPPPGLDQSPAPRPPAPTPAARAERERSEKAGFVRRLIGKLTSEEQPAAGVKGPAPAPAAAEPPPPQPETPAPEIPPAQTAARPPSTPARSDRPPAIGEIERRPAAAPRLEDRTRSAARSVVHGLQGWHRFVASLRLRAGGMLRSIMIFLAIALPLVLITVAGIVYGRYGRNEQYLLYYQQAEQMATQAIDNTDPIRLRQIWTETLRLLDLAESYQVTSQSRALRDQAQASLDGLLGIQRLVYQKAAALPAGTQIVRLAADDSNVYLLTAGDGAIRRLAATDTGYALDANFRCAPSNPVGPLVDLLVLPRTATRVNATVVGVDSAGNLLYCAPGAEPQSVPLSVPSTGLSRVTSVVLEGLNLYVLDANSNALWIYGNDGGLFAGEPNLYFRREIPEMRTAIDMAVNGDDLYLLHGDGHLATCNYAPLEVVPQRCQDPAVPFDPRPAAENGAYTLALAHFTQLLYGPPPDSALFLMDAERQTIFRLNPRTLEVQAQLQPLPGRANPLPGGPLTAMAIGPNRVLFVAVGAEVYFAAGLP